MVVADQLPALIGRLRHKAAFGADASDVLNRVSSQVPAVMADYGQVCPLTGLQPAPAFVTRAPTPVHLPPADVTNFRVTSRRHLRPVASAMARSLHHRLGNADQVLNQVLGVVARRDPAIRTSRQACCSSQAAGRLRVQLDGRTMDLPVVLRAGRTLARAAASIDVQS